jgi:AcrR family transcriptional regulator
MPLPHKLAQVAQEESRARARGGLPRLPPGRHGLPRAFVAENQRGRIATGMIEVVAERGYAAASVARVIEVARISRRTFYDHYADKEEAFFDVYRQVTDFLIAAMVEAGKAERGGWPARVRAELAALLAAYEANPDLARFTLMAPPAAGGDAAAAYREFLERLLAVIREGRPKRAKRPSPAAEYGLVGGLAGLLVAAVETGRGRRLEPLLPEVTELVLTPYLGRDAALAAATG